VKTIIEMLTEAGGSRRPGATDAAIAEAEAQLGVRLPDDHAALLRWSNGWEGEFGDTWLVLDDSDSLPDANDGGFREGFPGYVAIGGNGGLVTYALDYRQTAQPDALVAIDRVSADEEDIWPIASSLTESLARMLVQPEGPWDRPMQSPEPSG
jgi:hypothetical protein